MPAKTAPKPKKPAKRALLAQAKRISYGMEGFALFCAALGLTLHPYEETMLGDYFQGAIETVIIVPKKNGKTTLLSALALYHLFKVTRALCVIGASSRDQATYLFRQAGGMVQEAELTDLFDVKPGYREIRFEDGRIKVLAADATTVDGVIPTLALVDELHRHPSGDLYGVLRGGLEGEGGGSMVTISTAGFRADSPLGVLRQAAYEMPGFTRTGAYNHVKSPDGSFVLHEWCLLPEDDPHDMALVKTANPAPWKTLQTLQTLHDSPTTSPWWWLRYACGIWTEGEEPWIQPQEWDTLLRPELKFEAGEPVWLGVDIGTTRDSTAVVTVAKRGEGLLAQARVFLPPKGGTLSLELVEGAIREIARTFSVRSIAYDPSGFGRSAEILLAEGYPLRKYAQSPEAMTLATQTLYYLIQAGQLFHDGDPVLRAHVLAGITKQTERGFRLVKERRGGRMIDALIALEMACQVATEGAETAPATFSWL
jgi:phage terminase large subunit-like protein